MPRSDSGRAAARGGLNDVPKTLFRDDRSHHPGAGVGPPSRACARPSSAEEGSKKVESQATHFRWHDVLYGF